MGHLGRLAEREAWLTADGMLDLPKRAGRYTRLMPPVRHERDRTGAGIADPVERLEQRVWTLSFATCKSIDNNKPAWVRGEPHVQEN
jgi:hypothetical protein